MEEGRDGGRDKEEQRENGGSEGWRGREKKVGVEKGEEDRVSMS